MDGCEREGEGERGRREGERGGGGKWKLGGGRGIEDGVKKEGGPFFLSLFPSIAIHSPVSFKSFEPGPSQLPRSPTRCLRIRSLGLSLFVRLRVRVRVRVRVVQGEGEGG